MNPILDYLDKKYGDLTKQEKREIEGLVAQVEAEAVEDYVKWQYGERCLLKDTEEFPELKGGPKRCPICEAYERLDEYLEGEA